jgi:ribosomal protein S18 acetylase RimI-like enzyme
VDSAFKVRSGKVVPLGRADLPRLKDLCLACTAFYEVIEGRPATEATAAEIVGPLESKFAHGTKHVWGIEAQGRLVAVAELLEGHPTAHDWYIGLLLVAPEQRRQGVGSDFCRAILDWLAAHSGRTVRLVVHPQNVVARTFWERQGFELEREVVKLSGRLEGPVGIFVRPVGGTRALPDEAKDPT